MPQPSLRLTEAQRLFDPARGAARLLGWFGLSVLMVGAPLAGVLSRQALFILLPIGVGLLAAAFLIAVSTRGLKAFAVAMGHPIGMAAAFLFVWAGVSLVWAPFPGDAAPNFAASLATALFAALIIAHLPERRPMPALYLLPGGVAVTAIATLGMALFGPASFRGGSEFDSSLLERSVLTITVLVWPALGALAIFGRWRLAMGLAVLVAATIALAGASIAMAIFAIGAVTFSLAVDAPGRAGRWAAIVFAGLIVVGPLLPFLLAPLAAALPPVGRSTVAAMHDWRDLVTDDGLRLVTGHGLGTAFEGIGIYLPAHTPRTILYQVWRELGLLGALALAAIFALGLETAGRAARYAAPALLAGMAVTLAVTFFGIATAELWFVTLVGLQAVAFGLLCRSSRADPRPSLEDVVAVPEVARPPVPAAATLPHM